MSKVWNSVPKKGPELFAGHYSVSCGVIAEWEKNYSDASFWMFMNFQTLDAETDLDGYFEEG